MLLDLRVEFGYCVSRSCPYGWGAILERRAVQRPTLVLLRGINATKYLGMWCLVLRVACGPCCKAAHLGARRVLNDSANRDYRLFDALDAFDS